MDNGGRKRPPQSELALPPAKRHMKRAAAPLSSPPPASEEALSVKVLSFQNRQLSFRVRTQSQSIRVLEDKTQQLSTQCSQCITSICLLLQYWDQLVSDASWAEGTAEGTADSTMFAEDLAKIRNLLTAGKVENVQGLLKGLCVSTLKHLQQPPASGGAVMDEQEALRAAQLAEKEARAALFCKTKEHADVVEELKLLRFEQERRAMKVERLQEKLTTAERRLDELTERLHDDNFTSAAANAVSQESAAGDGESKAKTLMASSAELIEQQERYAQESSRQLHALEEAEATIVNLKRTLNEQWRASADNVVHSATYAALQSAFQVEKDRVDGLNEELRARMEDFKARTGVYHQELEQLRQLEEQSHIEVEAKINALTTELTELRNERDTLRAQVQVAASIKGGEGLSTETKQLLTPLQNHNRILKSEIKRLREVMQVDEQSGQLRNTPAEVKALREELRQAQETCKEQLLLLNVFKNSPKDMREKRELLVVERKLRDELAELQEKVACLPSSGLEKELQTARQELDAERQRRDCLQQALDARVKDEQFLMQEIRVTGQGFEEIQEQNSRLLSQLQEKEEATFRLMEQNLRIGQQSQLHAESFKALQEKSDAQALELDKKNDHITRFNALETTFTQNMALLEKRVLDREQRYEHERRLRENSESSKLMLEGQTEDLRRRDKEQGEHMSGTIGELEKERSHKRRLEDERDRLKKEMDRFRQRIKTGGEDEMLQAENADLRKHLNCGACKTRRKDTVILKCMHVFCNECVRAVLDQRSRKCPQCGLSFSATEYKRLYLT